MDAGTNMTPDWIERALKTIPCTKIMKDGVWTGNIRTCPVRLSFPNIFHRSKPIPPNTEGTYGAVLLFPLGADISLLRAEQQRIALENWPDAGKPGGPKLYNAIRDQDIDGKGNAGESERYMGYVKGAMRIGANANRLVPCVDQNMAPIVEEDRVYPGVWAVCSLSCFPFNKGVNKGPTFGLQSVMIIADDQNIGGTGQANPNTDFAGVKIDANLNPAAAFGAEGLTAGATEPASAADIFGA